jgi:hypothetical protein
MVGAVELLCHRKEGGEGDDSTEDEEANAMKTLCVEEGS